MLRPISLTVIITLNLIAQGCSILSDTEPAHVDIETQNQEIFIHTVNYPGETLELIGRWYTGGKMQRARIQKSNPSLTNGLLPLGTRVEIPHEIMSTDKLLPVEYVKKNSQESSSPFILNTPLENADSEAITELTAVPTAATITETEQIPTLDNEGDGASAEVLQKIVIPGQIVDQLKELSAEQTPTEEETVPANPQPTSPLPNPLPTPLSTIIIESELAPVIPMITATATISTGRKRLLEQMRNVKP
jgi:hypothetical protein